MLIIGVPSEVATSERRVALAPDGVARLVGLGARVLVERGAGVGSGFGDEAYSDSGAVVASRDDLLDQSSVILQVRGTGTHGIDDGVADRVTAASTVIGLFDPLWMPHISSRLAATGATLLALELVPRITRAQRMDVLSSMATVAGYEAVLLAASRAPRMFPMLMTAAGTVPATRVFVAGAGVAGLQAIATAKRLGAVVEAYDVRPAAVEQIRSVGAKAIELEILEDATEDAGGYARSQTDDQERRQRKLLTPVIADADVVITTAAIPGAASPVIVTAEMVAGMRAGSVIVDVAAERGGNCELTRADEEVVRDGVLILGPTDLVSRSSRNASQMLSNNIVALLEHVIVDGRLVIESDDEIVGPMLVAWQGAVVHPQVRARLDVESPAGGS